MHELLPSTFIMCTKHFEILYIFQISLISIAGGNQSPRGIERWRKKREMESGSDTWKCPNRRWNAQLFSGFDMHGQAENSGRGEATL